MKEKLLELGFEAIYIDFKLEKLKDIETGEVVVREDDNMFGYSPKRKFIFKNKKVLIDHHEVTVINNGISVGTYAFSNASFNNQLRIKDYNDNDNNNNYNNIFIDYSKSFDLRSKAIFDITIYQKDGTLHLEQKNDRCLCNIRKSDKISTRYLTYGNYDVYTNEINDFFKDNGILEKSSYAKDILNKFINDAITVLVNERNIEIKSALESLKIKRENLLRQISQLNEELQVNDEVIKALEDTQKCK